MRQRHWTGAVSYASHAGRVNDGGRCRCPPPASRGCDVVHGAELPLIIFLENARECQEFTGVARVLRRTWQLSCAAWAISGRLRCKWAREVVVAGLAHKEAGEEFQHPIYLGGDQTQTVQAGPILMMPLARS